ncbi:hypothetical protein DENIS_2195 [Desulfonema ishimotonii]|uniref:Dynamin N-terminal domain-containing protein n=1 Tax=Desulfonema ishimotonii TaxID=45657 RepID=A0A401FW89_9BACT|nr:dynamin family protein [Desulfonema ishimotonii]GBC61235.1 hypothetical protein DENIS_2195 [Desulfonema ishimotonii]
MEKYNLLKDDLLQINQDIMALISKAKTLPGTGARTFESWEEICGDIRERVAEEMLRVAVVGAIKSGKSTFVNSLFRGDYLKRGAGVVTSIVTRIHRSDALRARLWFKSWAAVNSEIEQALVLFPGKDWRSGNGTFDIRQEADRKELGQALDSLKTDLLLANDTLNTNCVLLSACLKGYDSVKDILGDETVVRQYEGATFGEHRAFVGDDALAVYLRDVRLEIDAGETDENIEIADCQGSDSPNPLHLAMIQDYLRLTHMIVYVISSRTGLRQADIKFLSGIKKMGIIDNAIFLVNFDFSEHDSLADLERVLGKVRDELALIRPEPEIYALSALFNLFRCMEKDLPVKDSLRLAQWKGDAPLASFSDQGSGRFETAIRRKLTRERYALLLSNHFRRLGIIASGIEHWATVNADLLTRDACDVSAVVAGLEAHRKKTDRLRSMIRSTLDGAVQKIRRSLRTDTDRFFDTRYGMPANVIRFIKGYETDLQTYESKIVSTGFSATMYLVFQEIKRAADTFMAESANPEVIRFIREQEENIREYFVTIARPYETMVQDALTEYNKTLGQLGIPPLREDAENGNLTDVAEIRDAAGIRLPPTATSMHYTASIKTEAVMKLGMYQIVLFFKKLFRKPVRSEVEGEMLALRDGISRLKHETEKSVLFNFRDYRENIKFQYIFKLADAVSDALYAGLMERFDTHTENISEMARMVGEHGVDKDEALALLKETAKTCRDLQERIRAAREEISEADE